MSINPPPGWSWRPLRDIVGSLRAGVSVNSTGMPAKNGQVGVLKTSAVALGQFRPGENKCVVESEIDRAKEAPRANSIIISRMNTPELVGANAFVDRNYPNLRLPDRLWQMRIKNDRQFCPRWLGYMMESKVTRGRISARATGTSGSMKNITRSDILGLRVLCPPMEEQQKVSVILATWDSAIQRTARLLEAKRELKKGLMQQLLTSRQRFSGSKDPWCEYRLGQIFRERKETDRGDLPLLSVTGEQGVIPHAESGRKDSSAEDKSKYKRIVRGDIGYNTMRMWQGVSALSQYEGIISPAYTVCIPQQQIHGQFAAHLFKFPPVVHLFHRYSQGMVSDTLNLKFPNFSEIKVNLPPIPEQRKIAAVLDAVDGELLLLRTLADNLIKQKRGLMQNLLTGQIRIGA